MKNMKKILTITLMVLVTNFVFAQAVENELKNFRFGLKVAPSVNWCKPDGKIIAANGVVPKFGGGLVIEIGLAKVISIQTGLQVDLEGGKVKYNNGGYITPNANTVMYYYNTIDDVIAKNNLTFVQPSDKLYQLNSRTYSVSYITLPLNLKMKTKEIGSFTYFAVVGLNNSFRWKATANDEVQEITANYSLAAPETKTKINVTKDVSFYKGSLNLGFGTEMNVSGTTSLTFGLNYNLGFTNVVKDGSDYLLRSNSANSPAVTKMPQQIKSNAIVLTVGVLF